METMSKANVIALPKLVRARYQSLYPELADKLSRFDASLYFAANPDVAEVMRTPEDLIRHFCEFGYRECRLYAQATTYVDLYSEAFPHLADKLRNFDPVEYWRSNSDVGGPSSSARVFFDHYCRYGATELRVTYDDGRMPNRCDSLRRLAGREIDVDIAVYAHIFFAEQGHALVPYLRNLAALGARVALSFSTATFSRQEMEAYAISVSAQGNADAVFVAAQPTGRDWGSFHRLWQRFPPAAETSVFVMHSKKSQHLAPVIGATWRNELLGPLCGSYGAVLGAAEKLKSGHSMVGSALHRSRNIGASRDLVLQLLPLLGLDPSVLEGEFIAGTMFAIRGDVLNEFFGVLSEALRFDGERAVTTQHDGSLAHACERLIGYLAAVRGKGIAWVV